MSIHLIGPWVQHPTYSEQRYTVVKRYRNYWIIVEEGWRRIGKLSEIYEHLYDPSFNPDEHEDALGYERTYGFCFVYPTKEDYLSGCTVDEDDIVDGLPCPSWAVACLI
jgi:flavin-dependent dehydrogenase